MIPQSQDRVLFLVKSKPGICLRLIEILCKIAAGCVVLQRLEVDAVLLRNLLLYLNGDLSLFDIVVFPLAIIGAVKSFNRIAEVSKRSKLCAVFDPCATAQIFSVGDQT